MKTNNYGIGWILLDVVMIITLIVDIWTGKLALDQLLKIVLLSTIGGVLFIAIIKKRIKKAREQTRASKKSGERNI